MRMSIFMIGFMAVALAPLACGGPENGIGQGQPAYPVRTGTTTPRLMLQIDAVFVEGDPSAAAVDSRGYVQISNRGATPVDFAQVHLSLVSSRAGVDLDPSAISALQIPLQPGAVLALGDAALAPFSQNLQYLSDQVAVVNDARVVQAYRAWGPSQPTTAHVPALTTSALRSGAITGPADAFTQVAPNASAATSGYYP